MRNRWLALSAAAISLAVASTAVPAAAGSAPSYVQPGTAGYRGAMSALTVYSAANGRVPAGGDCAWNQVYKFLRCGAANLMLSHVDIRGGLYWTGCGSLTMKDSVFDWYPSQTWMDVDDACQSPAASATITAVDSTFETSPGVMNRGQRDLRTEQRVPHRHHLPR